MRCDLKIWKHPGSPKSSHKLNLICQTEKDAYKAMSGNSPFHMLCPYRGEILFGLRVPKKAAVLLAVLQLQLVTEGRVLKRPQEWETG